MTNTEREIDYEDMKTSYKHCVDTIVEMKKTKKFMVGAAADLEDRLKELDDDTQTMYSLCKVNTVRRTRSLEEKLLNRFGKAKNYAGKVKVDKKTGKVQYGGGEGLNEKGDNYIYVVFHGPGGKAKKGDKKKAESDNDASGSESEEDKPKGGGKAKKAPAKKAPVKKAPAKKAPAKKAESDASGSESGSESEDDKPKKGGGKKAPAKKTAQKKTEAKSDSDDDSD